MDRDRELDEEEVNRIIELSKKLPEADREAFINTKKEKLAFKKELDASEINVVISAADHTEGIIYNREDGGIVYVHQVFSEDEGTKEKSTWLIHANLNIKGAVKTFNNLPGIVFTLAEESYMMSLDQTMTLLKRRYGLSSSAFQHTREILEHYVSDELKKGNVKETNQSDYHVSEEKITVDREGGEIREILRILREYHDVASHPAAFRGMMAWSLLAPLHYSLKIRSDEGIQAPIVILSGESKTGKTPLAYIFCGRGYDQPQKEYVYGFNRVKSLYTLTVHLSETNLPCVVDDVPMQWITENRDNLKTYMQMGIFADRGRPNVDEGLKEYLGVRSFVGTMNESFILDADKALSNRIIVYNFGDEELKRVNREAYRQLMKDLPKGFMFALAKAIFTEKDIATLMERVGAFSQARDWIEYGIDRINDLCRANGIREFPDGVKKSKPEESYVREVLDALISEYNRMQSFTTPQSSPFYGILSVEEGNGRMKVEFTATAFMRVAKSINVPFRTVSDMMNNITDQAGDFVVMNSGKRYAVRFQGSVYPLKAYGISIPIVTEQELEETKFL